MTADCMDSYEHNFYSEETIEECFDNDEMSTAENSFMIGYIEGN